MSERLSDEEIIAVLVDAQDLDRYMSRQEMMWLWGWMARVAEVGEKELTVRGIRTTVTLVSGRVGYGERIYSLYVLSTLRDTIARYRPLVAEVIRVYPEAMIVDLTPVSNTGVNYGLEGGEVVR